MRLWPLLMVSGIGVLGAAAGGCSALLGDFSVAQDAGVVEEGSPDRGGAVADGSPVDATKNGDGEAGTEDATLFADRNGGGTDSTLADATGGGDATELADGNRGSDATLVGDANGDAALLADSNGSDGNVTIPDANRGDGNGMGPPDATGCTVDGDCPAGYDCTASACVPQKSQGGSPCTRDAECQASLSCSPEGICCNAPCNGSCQVCNSAGMCVSVPANGTQALPRAGHPACTNGGAPCGGYCDGVDVGCFYPTVACRTASCGCYLANGCTASPAQNCANGSCPDPIYTSCNGFACDSTQTVCGDVCDPSAGTGCYGLNSCCHTVLIDNICFHSCTSVCPAAGLCE
jgi:hypothetical protein